LKFIFQIVLFNTSSAIYDAEKYYVKSALAKISIVWAKANIDGLITTP
jgi:hypothetical protein